MAMTVPAAKRDKKPVVDPGRYTGIVIGISPAKHEGPHRQSFHMIEWICKRDDATHNLVQICETDQELADVLVDLGLGGRDAEPTDAIAKSCLVTVATFGTRRYARVVDTEPLSEA